MISDTYWWLYYISYKYKKLHLSYLFQRTNTCHEIGWVKAQLFSYQVLHSNLKLLHSNSHSDIIHKSLSYFVEIFQRHQQTTRYHISSTIRDNLSWFHFKLTPNLKSLIILFVTNFFYQWRNYKTFLDEQFSKSPIHS